MTVLIGPKSKSVISLCFISNVNYYLKRYFDINEKYIGILFACFFYTALVLFMLEGGLMDFSPLRGSKAVEGFNTNLYISRYTVKRYIQICWFSKKKLESVLHRINLISPCLNF